jgi:hypothetical protein
MIKMASIFQVNNYTTRTVLFCWFQSISKLNFNWEKYMHHFSLSFQEATHKSSKQLFKN